MASLLKKLQEAVRPAPSVAMPAPIVPATPPPPHPPHPFYPLEAQVVGYRANEYNALQLLSMFAAGCAAIFAAAYVVVKRLRPSLSRADLSVILWFTLCGFIHLFFESYYALNFRSMGSKQDLFGQLWKEYSLSDSRYQTADSAFVLCMESITAVFWGPLSFLTAGLIAVDHPLRWPFQIIVSLGQLYGDVLYYATSMFDDWMLGLSYSRPEAAYYWGYFVFLNAFWIVIPLHLLVQAAGACWRAFAALDKADELLKRGTSNGHANGHANGSTKKAQ